MSLLFNYLSESRLPAGRLGLKGLKGLDDYTDEKLNKISEIHKSVQSVIQTSYDIVKAHGGEIKVESKVDGGNPGISGKGEGSEFIIVLPVV